MTPTQYTQNYGDDDDYKLSDLYVLETHKEQ